jgi:DNA modification methylase
MDIEKVNINSIKLNDKNPRFIKNEKFKKLVKSIKEFPKMLEIRPIVVDNEGIILGGNMRYKACLDAKLEEVYIIRAENLTEEQKQEFIIKDNVGYGEWDFEALNADWEIDQVIEWGLDVPDFNLGDDSSASEDEFEETDIKEPITVLGDLYEIGEHRLLCGDSTDSEQIQKLLGDIKQADMLLTDPPYLMDFQGGIHADGSKSFNSSHGGIKNDKMSNQEGDDFLDAINTNISLFVKGAFYIFFYTLKLNKYFASLDRSGLEVRALITWDKGNHTLSNSDYMSRCEHIFYGWVKEHNFYGGNNGMDIWNIKRTQKNDLHPTMKPIELCEKIIKDGSKSNQIVLDLFIGSGSTMVAAHQLKRKCFGLELDPKYCDTTLKRMKQLDPNLVIKRNGLITNDFDKNDN